MNTEELSLQEKRITELENSLFGMPHFDIKHKHAFISGLAGLQEGAASSLSSLPDDLSRGYLLKSFTLGHTAASLTESLETKNKDEKRDLRKDEVTDEEFMAQGDSDEDISPVTARPVTVQTTISLREMRTMITVQDIREYCAVLIVWSDPHNAYILFSVSPVFYFVKESSLRRMGVKWDRQSVASTSVGQRPNWLMATVTRLELCIIRKTDNRYNLKVGTKFYRVEVEPLQIDSSSTRRHADE